MDTDAILSVVFAYGRACRRGAAYDDDAEYNLAEIKRLLNEADAERQELLAENERLNSYMDSIGAGGVGPLMGKENSNE